MRRIGIIAALTLSIALTACGSADDPTYSNPPLDRGYCHSGDIMVWSYRLDKGFCAPRLCAEDEVLDWIAEDVRGCVHLER